MGIIMDKYGSPGYFTKIATADTRRKEFDIKNHSIIRSGRQPDFVFVGDSITHYWELAVYFNMKDNLIVNRGIGGDTTEYLKKRFYADVIQLKPKYCIMGIGVNDTTELEEDYWKVVEAKPYDEVLKNAQKNIENIIMQAKSNGITLILTTLLPINVPVYRDEPIRKRYIKEMNLWLKDISERENIILVNYYDAMVDEKTGILLDNIMYEGLHPDGAGYEIMARVLKDTLGKKGIGI